MGFLARHNLLEQMRARFGWAANEGTGRMGGACRQGALSGFWISEEEGDLMLDQVVAPTEKDVMLDLGLAVCRPSLLSRFRPVCLPTVFARNAGKGPSLVLSFAIETCPFMAEYVRVL